MPVYRQTPWRSTPIDGDGRRRRPLTGRPKPNKIRGLTLPLGIIRQVAWDLVKAGVNDGRSQKKTLEFQNWQAAFSRRQEGASAVVLPAV